MKERRVVITGAGGISPLGTDWESVKAKILSQTNAVKVIDDWADITGLKTRVACPAVPFALDPVKYGRKATRSMGARRDHGGEKRGSGVNRRRTY